MQSGKWSEPICLFFMINNLAPVLAISFSRFFASSIFVGYVGASIPNSLNISSVSSIIWYASEDDIYLNKSDFPNFGIKFNFPSENVPAPPYPDNIWHGLQFIHSFLFSAIGQHLFFANFPLSISSIFKFLFFLDNS